MIKADLHLHTCYSPDCTSPLKQIIACCQEQGINCVAVADHGTVEGALRLREMAPFRVIVGEEVKTSAGEVMGLFLKESIPNGIALEDAISRIKKQGGLVGVPHPFVRFGRSALMKRHVESIVERLDFIEVFNARSLLIWDSRLAREYAEARGLPGSAGSDAHTLHEIGHAYVEMDDFETKEEFLQSLKQGRVCGRHSGALAHFSRFSLLWQRLAGVERCSG